MAIVVRRASLRERQLRPHPARSAGCHRRRQPRSRHVLRRRRVDRAAADRRPVALRCRRGRLPRLQRHGRERRRPAGHAAPLAGRDLRRERAPQRRRGRRARGDGRHQAADRPDAGRQAHARAGRRGGSCASATSTSSSRASCRSRSRPSSGRCTRSRSCGPCASTRTRTGCCSTSTARGWPTRLPRWTSGWATSPRAPTWCRGAGPRSACSRPRRSWCSIRSSLRPCCTCASSRCSWRRRCASCRRSCWRCWRGICGGARPVTPTRWRRGWPTGVRDAVPLTQEVRANAVFAILPARRGRAAAEGLQVLRLGRAHRRGPLDVRVGHDRGGRRRLRRRDPGDRPCGPRTPRGMTRRSA